MVDAWTTPIAQHFPTQEPDTFRRLAQIIAAQKREMFDIRASVLANVSDIVADLTAKQAALAALVGTQIVVGSAAAEFGTSSAIALSANPAAPTTLTTLSVVVPAGVTKAIAITSVVPAIYTASGTGSFTSTVESDLTSGGAGAYAYAAEIVDVVDADSSTCTVTKSIVLTSVTSGATITMTATGWASGAGVLTEGDGSLTILFLR